MPSVSKLVDVEDVRLCVIYGIKEGWSLQDFLDSMEEWDSFVEIRHGHWVGIDDEPCETFECDRCGYIADINAMPYNFCPECGARMDKDV